MAALDQLYQDVILEHNRAPRNFRAMPDASAHADGINPLCGDEVTVWLRLDADERIADVSFQGQGCAISKASASIMTQAVKGKTRAEALALFERFHLLVTGRAGAAAEDEAAARAAFGKLAVFAGVSAYPTRVKCASLGWHTLKAALEGAGEVSTE
ncbi:MAG TPA: SUF system NifU family Fe-S cluster assembly protein [Gemmatimonadales bacterium]|nr:SUF system NifU family Fe-S cluster assembly protein [Gemmatimonadales bacterium]